MTNINKVRVITQDVPVHQTDTLEVLDGQATVQLTQSPVVVASVIITQVVGSTVTLVDEYTVDEQTGLVTFSELLGGVTITVDYDHVLLTDGSIQALIDIEDEAINDGSGATPADIRLAAADVLDAIASSQTLILKKFKLLDYQSDGPAVADSLRKHADTLRKQVFSDEFRTPDFDIIEQVYNPFGLPEKVLGDYLRQTGPSN
jgi:hypothetical protein